MQEMAGRDKIIDHGYVKTRNMPIADRRCVTCSKPLNPLQIDTCSIACEALRDTGTERIEFKTAPKEYKKYGFCGVKFVPMDMGDMYKKSQTAKGADEGRKSLRRYFTNQKGVHSCV